MSFVRPPLPGELAAVQALGLAAALEELDPALRVAMWQPPRGAAA